MAETITATFRKPFAEQIAAWRLRLGNLVPTQAWDDIQKAQHDRAFMVAGAMKADLLADLAEAVGKSIEQGQTLDQFRKDFRQIVEKNGWHGWTGEGTKKGEAWRTRVIYQTNVRTTYMAGRFAQLKAAGFKYWIYRHGGSAEPRLTHLGFDGLILPPDHPFWTKHYPPNGWGCSCRVLGAHSMRSAKIKGGDPNKTLPDDWDLLDARTGEPKGIGKGWGYAPGASVAQTIQQLAPKLGSLPSQPSIDMIQSWLNESLFGDWLANPKGNWPIARIAEEQAQRIGAKTPVVLMSEQTAVKQLREHPDLTVFDYGLVQRVVSEATEVIEADAKTLVYIFAPEGYGGHVLVVKATKSGDGLFATSFRRLSGSADVKRRTIERLRRRND